MADDLALPPGMDDQQTPDGVRADGDPAQPMFVRMAEMVRKLHRAGTPVQRQTKNTPEIHG